MKIKYYIREMRIHHYIKNLLVFVPLACSGQLFDTAKLLSSLWIFLSFCFIASAVYFINDIRDIDIDRKHPTKSKRPIAAGQISIKSAIIFTAVLIAASIAFCILCFNILALILLLLYFVLNLGYSLGLKNIPLLDVAILVSGFLIRTVSGAAVTNIQVSEWLYLVIIATSFYLGLGKRRNELLKHGDDSRQVIKKYSFAFLDRNMYVFMALIIVFYSLWTLDGKTVAAYHGSRLIWTVPVVIIIFMKYSLAIEANSDGDPVEILLHDKVLIGLCTLYLALMFVLLYLVK